MRRALFLSLAAALFCGCSLFNQRPEDQVRVEADGAGADETSSIAAARREAVSSVFDLFLSTATRLQKADALDKKILSRAKDFVGRERELTRERGAGEVKRRMEAWIDVSALARALDAEGLVRPDGVRGTPSVAVSIKQAEPAQKRAAKDLSDRGYRVDASGRADASLSASGTVAAVNDERLDGLYAAKAKVDGSLSGVGDRPQPIAVEAEAFDLTRGGASERALENAGLLAAEAARQRLSERFIERGELTILIENLDGAGQLRRFVETLRSEPAIAAASVAAVLGRDAKIRVFAERMNADELAARLMRLQPYALIIRAVDADLGTVEVVESGKAPEDKE